MLKIYFNNKTDLVYFLEDGLLILWLPCGICLISDYNPSDLTDERFELLAEVSNEAEDV